MASDLHVITLGASNTLIDEAVALLDHLERCWSRFLPHSDITRINNIAGGRLTVDPWTVTLITTMKEGHHVTGGRFDPTVLPALVASGYGTSRVDASHHTVLPGHGAPPSSIEAVRIDTEHCTVDVPLGLALDPGGIGKGLAADLTVAFLLSRGANGALVSIGGDLAMGGDAPDAAGWLIDVEQADPADGVLCSLAISGGGVATSSTRSRRWTHDGTERHHQIDPTTSGPSATDLAAVTIIGRAGWLAEVHATAAIGCGSAGVLPYLAAHGLSGIAIGNDRTVQVSPDLTGVQLRDRAGMR
ncbi:MAG: FAD:protein FMN transferase [Actinomycetota bacterium]|nr:FAD:protein FMN transferase [Actinomycetota bacterium]